MDKENISQNLQSGVEVKKVSSLSLLVRPLVRLPDIVQAYRENDRIFSGSFSKAFQENQGKMSVLACDGGGIKGLLSIQSLIQAEGIIKGYLLKGQNGVPLISKKKLQEILQFRSERLSLQSGNVSQLQIEPIDFDILLCDFFELCTGTSTGSIEAAYIATTGVPGALDMLLTSILENKIQSLVGIELENYVPKKKLTDELKEGLKNPKYGGICPQQGTIAGLSFLYYYTPQLIFTPNPTPNPFFFNSTPQKLEDPHDVFWKNIGSAASIPELFSKDRKYTYRYSDEGIKAVLKIVFQDMQLEDSDFFQSQLYIPSFDMYHKRPMSFFKIFNYQNLPIETDHGLVTVAQIYDKKDQNLVERRFTTRIANIVQASAAAPTYFPDLELTLPTGFKAQPEKIELIDGGMVSNDPTDQAVGFLEKYTQRGTQDFSIMSVGCGYSQNAAINETVPNIIYLLELFSKVALNADTFTAPWRNVQYSTEMKDAYLRVQRVSSSDYATDQSPVEKTLSISLDDISKTDDLIEAGKVIAESFKDDINHLLETYVIPRAIFKGLYRDAYKYQKQSEIKEIEKQFQHVKF